MTGATVLKNDADLTSRSVAPRALISGALAATMTFFTEDTEDLDLETLRKHVVFLARSGIVGIIALGSNGEAPHLSKEERDEVVREIRSALDEAGFHQIPIVCGTSADSVRGTVELIKNAKDAGADYGLVLPPSYFRGAVTPDLIKRFYTGVADLSPLPIILYSFPAVSAGVEMASELLIDISQHPRVIGAKFTCSDTGKLARVARAINATTPTATNSSYLCYGGMADITLSSVIAGGSGVIAGGANITPKICVKILRLFKEKKLEEAMELQKILSEGDYVHSQAGVAATKYVIEATYGYGGVPRKPLQGLSKVPGDKILQDMNELLKVESGL
ncbi:hypothetical protein VTL71DRAFT_6868 [Oculimacula yallundae]|uniref:Dihydrodipicolinate synthase n=1 Tax=Oculimacula yallundae TaxID=86028 RepID=A0ABR4BW87_9HELO